MLPGLESEPRARIGLRSSPTRTAHAHTGHLTRCREARNLGPAFHDRHPEQRDESTFCVEHDDMIALDLSARRDDRLSAYSGVLKSHQICFAGHFHFPGTSSASWTSCCGALAKGNVVRLSVRQLRMKVLNVTNFDRKSESHLFIQGTCGRGRARAGYRIIVLRLRNPYHDGRSQMG